MSETQSTNGNGHAKHVPLSEAIKEVFEKTLLPSITDFAGVIEQIKGLINAAGDLAIVDLVHRAEAKLKPILDALHKSEEESVKRKAQLIKDLTGLDRITEDSAMTICGYYDEAKSSQAEVLQSSMEQIIPLVQRHLVHRATAKEVVRQTPEDRESMSQVLFGGRGDRLTHICALRFAVKSGVAIPPDLFAKHIADLYTADLLGNCIRRGEFDDVVELLIPTASEQYKADLVQAMKVQFAACGLVINKSTKETP